MLHEFLESKRSDIITRTNVMVTARPAPRFTDAELTHGVPFLVDQLLETLKDAPSPDERDSAVAKRGQDLLRSGLTIGQVIHDYGHLGQAVTELAFELDARISVGEFRRLNRSLDNAVAQAVMEYARIRRQSNAYETERVVAAALLPGASPGTREERTFQRLNALIESSLGEARIEAVASTSEATLRAKFSEEMAFPAAKAAT